MLPAKCAGTCRKAVSAPKEQYAAAATGQERHPGRTTAVIKPIHSRKEEFAATRRRGWSSSIPCRRPGTPAALPGRTGYTRQTNCSNCLPRLFRRGHSKKNLFKRDNLSKNERFIQVIFKKTCTVSDSSKRFQNFSFSLLVFFISNPDMLIV